VERSKTGRIGALVLVSMVAGSLAVPRIAQAVGSVVTIQGGGSTAKAGVDKAQQLLEAEAAPGSFHEYKAPFNAQGCRTVATVPAGKALILKEIVVAVTQAANSSQQLVVYSGAGCAFDHEMLRFNGSDGTTTTVPLDPGFAVAAGGKISAQVGNILVDLHLFGYLVPKAAVPATTKITSG
jgi:hypothetical protein